MNPSHRKTSRSATKAVIRSSVKPLITVRFSMAELWSAVPEWMGKGTAGWEPVEILNGTTRDTQRDTIVDYAQQCAEKLMKARLIQLGQRVRKTHDLTELSNLLHAFQPPPQG